MAQSSPWASLKRLLSVRLSHRTKTRSARFCQQLLLHSTRSEDKQRLGVDAQLCKRRRWWGSWRSFPMSHKHPEVPMTSQACEIPMYNPAPDELRGLLRQRTSHRQSLGFQTDPSATATGSHSLDSSCALR